ncbi:MAG: 2-isopropylmalate synthase [Elusimicrobia bacterium]|nr:2-isopropylmalate synthase [Elusimicrobiota bacterium]
MNKILIFDTTLRDGEQCPGASLNPAQKLEIARQLDLLGVDIIEAGFPVSSPGDFESVKLVAKKVRGPVISGLARAVRKDIETCAEAIAPAARKRIHTFIATSDIHLKYKLKKSREDVLDITREAVRYARNLCDDVEFSAEDAARSDIDYLCRVVETAVKAGAATINIPDTVGYTVPDEFSNIIKTLLEKVPLLDRVVLSVHCHNDLGLAVSNSISAIINGARQVECTINGIGERAGNASLEEIVMILRTRRAFFRRFNIEPPSVDARQIYKTSRMVSHLTGLAVQPNKAIVGANAFAHEAGIHQDGVLKKRLTYEIMTPQSVGIPSSNIVLGKHSGRHAFSKRLGEMGFSVRSSLVDSLFREFKALTDKKKYVFDEDIISLVEERTTKKHKFFSMAGFRVTTGTSLTPDATVKLHVRQPGSQRTVTLQESASGDGPVDAAFKAADKIVAKCLKWKSHPKLIDYSIRSVTIGKDAQGEVSLKVRYGGDIWTGRGTSTDILEGSIKSYIDVLNKIVQPVAEKNRIKQRCRCRTDAGQ